MGLWGKKKIFNAVLEGCYHDNSGAWNFKLLNILVPVRSETILDDEYSYGLYRELDDSDKADEIRRSSTDLEHRIACLRFCKGIVLLSSGEVSDSGLLERPRSLYLGDGRIYVERGISNDRFYLERIPKLLSYSKTILGDKGIQKKYSELC